MHKRYFFILLNVFLIAASCAHAAIPKAGIQITPLTHGEWPAEYRVSMDIPEDHHAYLDKGEENIYIPVEIDPKEKLNTQGLALSKIQRPEGVHDSQVKATVLRNQGDFTVWLESNNRSSVTPKKINLEVRYQLCNDRTNVCFRPTIAAANLDLPTPKSAERVTAGETEDSVSFMDRLMGLFKDNQDNTLYIFGLMFIAGSLSVATPCVYPMLPITSMFIGNRAGSNTDKAKYHALAYLVGIIGSYMILGLLAGMTGGAFNAFMQSAIVNITFALFFAFFAVSLLGFYELSFMQNEVNALDQHSSNIKGLPGTWLMGTVAGLVISPCVGPIVFALLLQVADTIALQADALSLAHETLSFWDKFTIAFHGSVMMSGFGLGVGIPFFLVSVIKFKKLPKAGYWMNKIKYGFGFVILYFAYIYFDKGMGILGIERSVTLSLVFGMIALWVAIIHCNVLTMAPPALAPNQKLYCYCGVLSLILGSWLVIVGLNHITVVKGAHATPTFLDVDNIAKKGTAPAALEEGGIEWHRDIAEAQKVAQQTGKPIFIDFYASWCANCEEFKQETVDNDQLNQVLRENAIAVKLVDKEPDFESFRNNPEHRQLKIGLPYFAILLPDGQLAWSGTDYKATKKMISKLKETFAAVHS